MNSIPNPQANQKQPLEQKPGSPDAPTVSTPAAATPETKVAAAE